MEEREVEAPGRADLAALALAYFAGGAAVSVAVTGIGTPAWLTLVVAATAYSATGELAFVATVAGGGSAAAAVVAGWLVSTRFGLLAVSLGNRFPGSRLERALAAFTAVEPSVALALAHRDSASLRRTYWRVSLALLGGYLAGSVVGVVLGNVVGDPKSWGLDAVLPASLVPIVWRSSERRDGATAAAVGAGLCLLLVPRAPGGVPLIAALGGPLLAMAVPARPWRRNSRR